MHRLCALLAIACCFAASAAAADQDLSAALAELDTEFDDCFRWWGAVYDPVTGGCFYSLSAKLARDAGERGFGPDIEATSKLVNVLDWDGLLEVAPAAFTSGIVRYCQQRQDPQSGFFRDPQFSREDYTHNTLSRALGMATGALRRCGGEPLHPLPAERLAENAEAATHFAHLRSPEDLLAWIDALPWERRIWTVGARLRAQSGSVRGLSEPLRSRLLDAAEADLLRRQHADGYWGRPDGADDWASRLSGSYKIAAFLQLAGRPIPRAAVLREHVLRDLFERDYEGLIVLYNTSNMLAMLAREGLAFEPALKLAILRRATAIIHEFHAPGGGFATRRGHPSPVANGKRLAKDVYEGNTNATGLAHKSRDLLYELVTGAAAPPHPRRGDLLEALERAAR